MLQTMLGRTSSRLGGVRLLYALDGGTYAFALPRFCIDCGEVVVAAAVAAAAAPNTAVAAAAASNGGNHNLTAFLCNFVWCIFRRDTYRPFFVVRLRFRARFVLFAQHCTDSRLSY